VKNFGRTYLNEFVKEYNKILENGTEDLQQLVEDQREKIKSKNQQSNDQLLYKIEESKAKKLVEQQ
jgi:hypothetical protein